MMPSLRYISIPNAVTLLGLSLAMLSVSYSLSHVPTMALVALIWAGICDMIDGQLARRSKRSANEQRFGQALDSLVDVVSFGIAPVAFLATQPLQSGIELFVLATIYIVAVVMRLAYFDVHGVEEVGARRYYSGMPVTYAAFTLPLLYVVTSHAGLWIGEAGKWVAFAWLALTAIFFLSAIPFRKPSGVGLIGCLAGLVLMSGFLMSQA
jgi:CDP-diacylglycerol---serine O-phosphatidyltransferase